MIGNMVGTITKDRICIGEEVDPDRRIEGSAICPCLGVEQAKEVAVAECPLRMFRRILIISSIRARTRFTTKTITETIVTKIFTTKARLTTILKLTSTRTEAAGSPASRTSPTWAEATPQQTTEQATRRRTKVDTTSTTDNTPTTTTHTVSLHPRD